MSTTIATPNFTAPQMPALPQQQAPSLPIEQGPKLNVPTVRNDAEVVAKVISTPIKSSNIAEATQESRAAIAKAAQEIESFMLSMGRNLNISVDGNTGYHVVTVSNPATGEVIRQMPSQELLKIAQSLPKYSGLMLNTKA
jgi:flagellar protein FlaG